MTTGSTMLAAEQHQLNGMPVAGPAAGAVGMICVAMKLLEHGLDWTAVGASLGAAAMLINAVANASRAYREWKRPGPEPKKP